MSSVTADTPPVIEDRGQTFGSVTDRIVGVPLHPPGWRWLCLAGLALTMTMMMAVSMGWLLTWGVGVWGVNIPVAWGFAITNFVWWVGIGHAGTFISAILLLLKQSWRNSINRFAEAMTLFAVANAGLFPLLHLGRVQRFYYLFPYPDTMDLWPQWRSPLVWDVFAVMTYFTVSLLFWYLGLIPDLATLRDQAKRTWVRVLAGIGALGWRGEARQWQHHQMLYLLLAGLATPLVVSVHSVVSLDFAVAMVPGWHSAIFPPYFVAGAIFSGFAMVITIAIPVRKFFAMEDLITTRHLDNLAKVMLVTGLIVAYGYIMEHFTAFFGGDQFEIFMVKNRILGPYWPVFWITMTCNVAIPQLLWFRYFRVNALPLFIVAQFITIGMWTERYMIVITSLHRDFMPTAWGIFHGTVWDWTLLWGTIGFFVLNLCLFVKLLPMISIYEIRELLLHRGRGIDPEPYPPNKSEAETPVSEQLPLPPGDSDLFGVVAEFERPSQLIEAAKAARSAGYRRLLAYSPLPLEELPEAMGLRQTVIPLIVLIAGVIGGLSAFGLQYYAAVIDYPWNIGGRPDFSWPSFIPLTFELTILCGSLAGVVGLLVLNRFPQPYHPVSNAPGFERASRDRFFLCIQRGGPPFDRRAAGDFFRRAGAMRVSEVAR